VEVFGDGLAVPNYLGRTYLSGVRDCWTLVRDWYSIERGKVLENLPRDSDWHKSGDTQLMSPEIIARNGLVIVDKSALKIGDILVMRLGSKVPNHVALYIGNNLIMHHLEHKVSHREVCGRWIDNCLFCARLP
jgi:cell wall-associated NlpC family hydrolase